MVGFHRIRTSALIVSLTAGLTLQAGEAGSQTAAHGMRETAVAPEINPPGDIPDDQVFIRYVSPSGFSLEVPEGWSRTDKTNGATFVDKYGSIDVVVEMEAAAPTLSSIRSTELPLIKTTGSAVEILGTVEASMPAGPVVVVDYRSNSEVNPVTDRRIRLESRRIYYSSTGRNVVVTLSAPAGADNVDQWKLIAESFRWTS